MSHGIKENKTSSTVVGLIIGLLGTINIGLTGIFVAQNNQIKWIKLINEKN